MASAPKSLISDLSIYRKSFAVFKECTTGVQCTDEFLENELPDILERIVDGKSHLNIIGVGAGSGEVDLKILSVLHQSCPQVTVDNEVVEPSYQHLCDYRDLVSTTPGLEYIKFNWNEMTAEEFEEHWKEKKMTKKADIIHMFHMLYFVKDVEATISFYQSLLDKNGKLLISMVTSDCGAGRLGKTFQFCKGDLNYVYTDEIKRYLDSKGMNYQSYELPSQTNITPCFSEEDEKGGLLLDFITGVLHFRKTVSPELKDEVIEFIRHPDCSVETKGKVMYKHNYGVMVIDQGYIPGSRLNKLYV